MCIKLGKIFMSISYLRIDNRTLKLLTICVLFIYCSLFFLPNSFLHTLYNRNVNNAKLSEAFDFSTYLCLLPARIDISNYSLCKFSKLTLFKEAGIIYTLSIVLFCLVTSVECITLYLARLSSCYSLAPPTA